MVLNICMTFQENIFNGFHVKHRHDFVTKLLLTSSKGNNEKCIFKSYGCCAHRLMMLTVILV